MRAARFYGGKDIRIETVPDPVPEADEVLIRVRAAGICGSDLHGYRDPSPGKRAPRTPGHELAGEVLEVGSLVSGLQPGDRVAIEPLVGCGHCAYCVSGQYHLCDELQHIGGVRSGGFAELAVAPHEKAFLLPDSVSMDAGSLLDVYAVAVHALTQVPIRPGDKVAVIGTGAIGLGIAQLAALSGAASVAVLGRRPGPLQVAAQTAGAIGIDVSAGCVAEAVATWTEGRGADVVYEAVGGTAETLDLALQIAAKRGRVGVVGSFREPQRLDTRLPLRRELTVAWVWSYAMRGERPEFEIALDLLASGKLQAEPLITHRFPLDRIADAFVAADQKAAHNAIKVLVLP